MTLSKVAGVTSARIRSGGAIWLCMCKGSRDAISWSERNPQLWNSGSTPRGNGRVRIVWEGGIGLTSLAKLRSYTVAFFSDATSTAASPIAKPGILPAQQSSNTVREGFTTGAVKLTFTARSLRQCGELRSVTVFHELILQRVFHIPSHFVRYCTDALRTGLYR